MIIGTTQLPSLGNIEVDGKFYCLEKNKESPLHIGLEAVSRSWWEHLVGGLGEGKSDTILKNEGGKKLLLAQHLERSILGTQNRGGGGNARKSFF